MSPCLSAREAEDVFQFNWNFISISCLRYFIIVVVVVVVTTVVLVFV